MEKKISGLETKIKVYSFIGWLFVILATIPLGNVGWDVFKLDKPWPEDELGTFLGGVSGTFAALAGVFFVFVAFLGQRISILQQQIEIQNNIAELRETREEIRGQKEQLELQNKNFENQLFESTFFNLLTNYKNSLSSSFRGSWSTDFNNKLNSLLETTSIKPNGDALVRIRPGLSFETIDKKEVINAINDFPADFLFGIKDALAPIIAILFHISDKNSTHHLRTLIYSIPKRDKLIFFYYYISNEDKFLDSEKTELIKLFKAFPLESFKAPNHQEWV